MNSESSSGSTFRSHLIALGCKDVATSLACLEELDSLVAVDEYIQELTLSADVDLVLQQTVRLIRNSGKKALDMLQLPFARHRWIQLASASRALSDFCIQHPDTAIEVLTTPEFIWNFEEPLLDVRQSTKTSYVQSINNLRHNYRRELLAIAIADLANEASFETTSLRLSDLADITLESALHIAKQELQPQSDCTLAIIAMGKTGGRELNYISDVDVLFVVGDTAEDRHDLVLKEATQIAQLVMYIVASSQTQLPLWEIDPNLRPEGKDGALVRTVASYFAYYERWAETWEFQALLKARVMAGDRAVGEVFVEKIQPLIWRAAERENFVNDVQAMRRRVIENIPPDHEHRELKLGIGGLRDIEFAIQLLQLVHGKSDEAIRSANTLVALDSLMQWGYVGRDDAETLRATYVFERTLEHRIQMFDMKRTHLLPEAEDDLRRLGKLVGFGSNPIDGLTKSLQHQRTEARRLHEKLFYKPLLQAVARVDSDVVRMSLDSATTRLAALGFLDPEAALRHIQFLTTGVSRRAIIQRNLLPVVLSWMAETPHPDGGLLRFRNMSEALGETPWYVRLLRDESLVLQRLAIILCVSPFISSMLERNPEAMQLLSADESLQPRHFVSLSTEMQQTAFRQANFEEAVLSIRQIRQRELIRISTADIFGLLSTEDVVRALSDLTDSTLESALATYRHINPIDDLDVAIIGLGRYGGREITYASDADVVLVFDTKRDLEISSTYVSELATALQRNFSLSAASPPLAIDYDLRPEGKNGPTARSIHSYRDYYEKWSLTWENQALLRARHVAGNVTLGNLFLDVINPFRYPSEGLTESQLRDIRMMKARVESERLPRGIDPKLHLKLGPGGLSDIEWLVQIVQLNLAHERPELKTISTIEVLNLLPQVIGLPVSDVNDCKEAWLMASKLRNYLHIVESKDKDALILQPKTLSLLAYLLHEQTPSQVLEHWLRLARRARKIFTQVVYETPYH